MVESHGTLFRLLLKTVLASVCFVACGTLAVLTIVEALAAKNLDNSGVDETRMVALCLEARKLFLKTLFNTRLHSQNSF